jgi:hypothetical protein
MHVAIRRCQLDTMQCTALDAIEKEKVLLKYASVGVVLRSVSLSQSVNYDPMQVY